MHLQRHLGARLDAPACHHTTPQPSTNISCCSTPDTASLLGGISIIRAPSQLHGRLMPLAFNWQHYSDRVKRFPPADRIASIFFVQGAL